MTPTNHARPLASPSGPLLTRRQLLAATAALGLTAGLAACASSGGETTEHTPQEFQPALDASVAGEVRVVGNYSNFEALEAEFDKFSEVYPNVELSYTKLDDYTSTLGPALDSADAPDVYFNFAWAINKPNCASWFEHALNLADPSSGIDLSCVREGLLYTDANGAVPMFPVFSTTYGMLVNEDLFEREGLAVPATYDELLSACDALRQAGYASPMLGYVDPSGIFHIITFPYFCQTIADDEQAVEELNALEPAAGEYMRPSLELLDDMLAHGCMDLAECAKLEDGYEAMILRFFEGDVPMVLASGDTVSGMQKREALSEAFSKSPFAYRLYPVPTAADGGTFYNGSSVEFSVNKAGKRPELALEFVRFLASVEELDAMAAVKRLISASADVSYDGVYGPLGEVDASHVVYSQELGLMDEPGIQQRMAAYAVGSGKATVDEAIAAFGTYSL